MSLESLAKRMSQKEREMITTMMRGAQRLTLREILKAVDFDPKPFSFWNYNFRDGQPINLEIHPSYVAIINKDELVVRAYEGIAIRRFSGRRVQQYYNKISKTIQKAILERRKKDNGRIFFSSPD